MRRPQLRIVEYGHSATSKYCIEGVRINGKRKRLFFKTKTAAEQELTRLKQKQRQEGENALSLSDSLRIEALECSAKLKPFSKSLTEATAFYVRYLENASRSIEIEELVTEYLALQKRLGRSVAHQLDLKGRLSRFQASFGSRPLRLIETAELERWLHGLGLSGNSINNFRARLGALFSYALKRGYVDSNPIAPIDKIKVIDRAPEIFRPEELEKVLSLAPPFLLPSLALGAFAGLRTAELMRLEWRDIDLARGYVEITAAKAKSAQRRLVEISANLAEWLEPYSSLAGRLFPFSGCWYHLKVEELWPAAGLSRWPSNGLRHSFASYHLAQHQNAALTALALGHQSTKMVFAHYRELVRPQDAARYWQIKPKDRHENVVPIRKAIG